jgi:hypothetical protein
MIISAAVHSIDSDTSVARARNVPIEAEAVQSAVAAAEPASEAEVVTQHD